jgi:hypothetical protein
MKNKRNTLVGIILLLVFLTVGMAVYFWKSNNPTLDRFGQNESASALFQRAVQRGDAHAGPNGSTVLTGKLKNVAGTNVATLRLDGNSGSTYEITVPITASKITIALNGASSVSDGIGALRVAAGEGALTDIGFNPAESPVYTIVLHVSADAARRFPVLPTQTLAPTATVEVPTLAPTIVFTPTLPVTLTRPKTATVITPTRAVTKTVAPKSATPKPRTKPVTPTVNIKATVPITIAP